ncbi:histidine-rich glycoprotein-like [Plodia interpunctella]|uniref:histidine-rich glycoprotein-like n=1 Tax=Plodia interpunctella TaxID=58824 RepID=UPI002367F2ED|nr:histidine-rich glycoprotein-like [Plodia interpunctella]
MIVKVSQILSVVCLALCVLGDGPAISEQKVILHNKHHGELSHIGAHEPEHHEEYAWAYPSYEFSYSVNDPHTHDHKGQSEARHGDEVKGEYWLIEPDGRKRTVKYHADKHSGFNAHVEYSAPHHHVHFKTHKHLDHKPEIVHHHEEHKPHIEHKPLILHHDVPFIKPLSLIKPVPLIKPLVPVHKPLFLHHVEHKPVFIHHDDHKPVVEHHDHHDHHDHHGPWLVPKYYGHHELARPILRKLQENYHHGHNPRFYRTPKE